jgi:hypothetical protein
MTSAVGLPAGPADDGSNQGTAGTAIYAVGGAGNGEATAGESGGAPREAGVAAAIEKIKV